jgi:GNAT superfamily N-acetyltransferase
MKPDSKFFRHYKNKPYRYVGVAKHSEELKDYVIYECLYPNALGTLWIRPKDMFFEVGTYQEKHQPRFAQVDFSVKLYTELVPEVKQPLFDLCKSIFGDFDSERFVQRLKDQKNSTLFCFFYENELVGFKAGYQTDSDRYYSWLGAVAPKYRKLGVALTLMQHQHDWVKSKNYTWIETKSDNRYKEMMALNLKFGFNITGTESTERAPVVKILFQKKL